MKIPSALDHESTLSRKIFIVLFTVLLKILNTLILKKCIY